MGLCFHYDEKFTPRHRCKDQRLQVFTFCDEGEDTMEQKDVSEEEEEHHHLDVAKVLLNSMVRFTLNHGEGQEVVVLIDCGTTHNFISNYVVDKLCLSLSDIGSFGVVAHAKQHVSGEVAC
jgi:hypothetical protein